MILFLSLFSSVGWILAVYYREKAIAAEMLRDTFFRESMENNDGWQDSIREVKRLHAEIERLKQKDSADWWKEER